MPREVNCPQCGIRLTVDAPHPSHDPELDLESGHTVEAVVPHTHGGDADITSPLDEVPFPTPSVCDVAVAETLLSVATFDPPPTEQMPAGPHATPSAEAPATRESSSWIGVLLASYASAMTMAFAWLWTHPRQIAAPAPSVVAESVPETYENGRRGERSQIVTPPIPVPESQTTTMGQALRVGSIEVTPLRISRGPVVLEHVGLDGVKHQRDGGSGVLILQLRLKNTSTTEIFAPLDEAFLREPDRGLPDSFIETPDGSRTFLYPLPIVSEWSIAGQVIRELKPGESYETAIVSNADTPGVLTSGMTWRLHLRTGATPGQSELIGVKVGPDQVEPEAEAEPVPPPSSTVDPAAAPG